MHISTVPHSFQHIEPSPVLFSFQHIEPSPVLLFPPAQATEFLCFCDVSAHFRVRNNHNARYAISAVCTFQLFLTTFRSDLFHVLLITHLKDLLFSGAPSKYNTFFS